MPESASTPAAATPAAAARKTKEKKGGAANGARKRGELDSAAARKEEPPRKYTQQLLGSSATKTPAAAAADAAAVGVRGSGATRGAEGMEMEQQGQSELVLTDAELLEGVDVNGSPANSDDLASAAASYSSRPGSRASSTDALRENIARLESEVGGQAELPAVLEEEEPEHEQEQQQTMQQPPQSAEQQQNEGGEGGGSPNATSGLTQYVGQAGMSEDSESEEILAPPRFAYLEGGLLYGGSPAGGKGKGKQPAAASAEGARGKGGKGEGKGKISRNPNILAEDARLARGKYREMSLCE